MLRLRAPPPRAPLGPLRYSARAEVAAPSPCLQPRGRSFGPGAPGACGASPERPSGRGAPRLAASWPRRRRWLDTAGPLGRLPWVPLRLPHRAASACYSMLGCGAERRERGASGPGARGHRAATSRRGLRVWGSRAGGAATAHLLRTLRGF